MNLLHSVVNIHPNLGNGSLVSYLSARLIKNMFAQLSWLQLQGPWKKLGAKTSAEKPVEPKLFTEAYKYKEVWACGSVPNQHICNSVSQFLCIYSLTSSLSVEFNWKHPDNIYTFCLLLYFVYLWILVVAV